MDECGIVRVPNDWSAEQQQEAVKVFRHEYGLPDGAKIEVMQCSVAIGLETVFAGNISDMMAHVAIHGRRVGQSPLDRMEQ
jgi:hypothetical protein